MDEAATRARAALTDLFGPGVAVAVWDVDVDDEIVASQDHVAREAAAVEAAAVERAVAKRRTEFTRGRACARAALRAAGGPTAPIPVGPNREPVFPDGFVGSITHCDGLVAAVVGRGAEGLGVDAERVTRLESGVLEMILTDSDEDRRGAAQWARPEHACLLFSAKEAVFKAVFPSSGVWIGFEDVGLSIDDDSFRVVWTSDRIDVPQLARVRGRWTQVHDLMLAGCWLEG